MQEIFWLAEQLLGSLEGLCCMKLNNQKLEVLRITASGAGCNGCVLNGS